MNDGRSSELDKELIMWFKLYLSETVKLSCYCLELILLCFEEFRLIRLAFK